MDKSTEKTALSKDLQDEFALFEALKPYIGRCLSLNHELNNVLAGILGYTDFLLEESDSLSEDQQHYVQQISKCADRIQKTLMSLSDQKIELGQNLDMRKVAEHFQNYDPSQSE